MFSSDSSVSFTGFHATWKAVRKGNLMSDLGTKNFFGNNSSTLCKNRTLVQNSGWIESLGYSVHEDVEVVKFEQDMPLDCWISIIAPGRVYEYYSRVKYPNITNTVYSNFF